MVISEEKINKKQWEQKIFAEHKTFGVLYQDIIYLFIYFWIAVFIFTSPSPNKQVSQQNDDNFHIKGILELGPGEKQNKTNQTNRVSFVN